MQGTETTNRQEMSMPPLPAQQTIWKVPLRQMFVYGTGNVLIDMCTAMWFTYLLIFFEEVLGIIKQVQETCRVVW